MARASRDMPSRYVLDRLRARIVLTNATMPDPVNPPPDDAAGARRKARSGHVDADSDEIVTDRADPDTVESDPVRAASPAVLDDAETDDLDVDDGLPDTEEG